jgi:1-phosphatidylinositol-3-phosphate 5-kinase
MKNTLSAPLSSAAPTAVLQPTTNNIPPTIPSQADQRRSSHAGQSQALTHTAKTPGSERPNPFLPQIASAAPPLVSLTPAQPEVPSLNAEFEGSPSRGGAFLSGWDSQDGGMVGTTIPGFPIADDARSVRTSASVHRSGSVSKVIRRLRGEGMCYSPSDIYRSFRDH